VTLDRGTVVLVELDPTVGREQRGVRPCIAVSDPSERSIRFLSIDREPVVTTAALGTRSKAVAKACPRARPAAFLDARSNRT
jgi:mRNA-degrading endonuclease toxin of MazEF toxin-antitoxin module